ncbi:MAG: type III-A CRISPR-associated protein Cas10/Csm1 [Bacteroidota bacterium]
MSDAAPSLLAYALTQGLSQYSGLPDPVLPDCVVVEADVDRWVRQAGLWALNGEQPRVDAAQPVGLQPISECLQVLTDEEKETAYVPSGQVFPFVPLDISDAEVLPQAAPTGDYAALWKGFGQEYQKLVKLTGARIDTFTESLVFLLKKYTSCIPVGQTGHQRGQSLFEYLKLRAAIAHSLYRAEQSRENPAFPLLLFCADLSGIQDFVYDIVRSKALKGLKGRSFYLQLLMDGLIQELIDEPKIAISIAHVVYNSGGKMYVILPHTSSLQAALQQLQAELDKRMWDDHGGRLAIHTAAIPFRYADQQVEFETDSGQVKQAKGVGELWEALRQKTARRKYQPFQSVLAEQYDAFFGLIEEGVDENQKSKGTICSITGERVIWQAGKEDTFNLNGGDASKKAVYVSEMVLQQARLGYQMKNVIHYNTQFPGQEGSSKGGIEVFPVAKVQHRLQRPKDFTREYFFEFDKVGLYVPSLQHSRIRLINRTDFLQDDDLILEPGAHSSYGFAFYGGNAPAFVIENGAPKPFRNQQGRFEEKDTEQLSGGEAAGNFARLGILRMDVDNLGYLFQHGFQAVNTFTAYATFSAQLDWFFGGYLSWLRDHVVSEQGDPYKDWINVLYSGGDDLFLFGRWDLVLEMAQRIRADFGRFVCQRPGLSISGGLALIKPKFPFSKGAEFAGAAEKEAKGHPGKDGFHLLGQTIGWGAEFEGVWQYSARIFQLLEEGRLSQQFLYKLYHLKGLKDRGHNDWVWLIVYHLSQSARTSNRKDPALSAFFDQVKNEIFTNRWQPDPAKAAQQYEQAGRTLDLYVLAAQLAELRQR